MSEIDDFFIGEHAIKYFEVPLYLLAYSSETYRNDYEANKGMGDTSEYLFMHKVEPIVLWGTYNIAEKIIDSLGKEKVLRFCEWTSEHYKRNIQYTECYDHSRQFAESLSREEVTAKYSTHYLACHLLYELGFGYTFDYETNIRNYSKALDLYRGHINKYKEMYGNNIAYVSVPIEYCLEVSRGEHKFQDLKILMAIYSYVGRTNEERRITVEQIYMRTFGFRSKKIYKEFKGELLLTAKEYMRIYRIVKKLFKSNFFNMITYNNRETHYSTRLDMKALNEKVYRDKVKSDREFQKYYLEIELNQNVKSAKTKTGDDRETFKRVL